MSTSYNPLIPNPPDAPSADVPIMQTNASAISNLIVVDHVGFGRTNSGQHQQVTFAGNNTPGATPVDPSSILFTKNDAFSTPQLTYYNSENVPQYYFTTNNGSTVLMGGIILKWGLNTGNSPVVFSAVPGGSAFPNTCFNVSLTAENSGTQVNVTAVSATQFSFASNPSGLNRFYWIAIGN